jgi:hypothetical protein
MRQMEPSPRARLWAAASATKTRCANPTFSTGARNRLFFRGCCSGRRMDTWGEVGEWL